MSQKTQTYNLSYFKRGSIYNGEDDFKRFTTVDYNMESYIGIIGDGIIEGWNIKEINNLNIQITPGNGIINGFFTESPYVVKKRSEMNFNEKEIEVIETNIQEHAYQDLNELEREKYVSIIQEYDPEYDPIGPIENFNVKVVVPQSMSLYDNSDNYIYAVRNENKPFYPELNEYPIVSMTEPDPRKFINHSEYNIQRQIYLSQINAIKQYNWRDYGENHFTEIQFQLLKSPLRSNNAILLSKITTRDGEIFNIDISSVKNIKNLEYNIKTLASQIIENHKHNNIIHNPPKIKLETTISEAVLYPIFNVDSKLYLALNNITTSTNRDHNHNYYIDGNGDGFTVGINGVDSYHFHYIKNWIVQNNIANRSFRHNHNLLRIKENQWKNEDQFIVLKDDKEIGNNFNTEYNSDKNNFILKNYSNVYYKNYSTSFDFITTAQNGRKTKTSYSYSEKSQNLLSFLFNVILDFVEKHGLPDAGVSRPVRNRFEIFTVTSDDYPFVCLSEKKISIFNNEIQFLENSEEEFTIQSINGDYSFTKDSDINVVITPPIARSIKVVVVEKTDYIPKIEIEILNKTEVNGIINEENIAYINAKKIIMGEFKVDRIPFLNHNLNKEYELYPSKQYLKTFDFNTYYTLPYLTSVQDFHYHSIAIDYKGNGKTIDIFNENKNNSYYFMDKHGNEYNVNHSHKITDGNIESSENIDLYNWIKREKNQQISNTPHNHEIIYPLKNISNVIYSIKEIKNNDIVIGTSNGLYCIPRKKTCIYIINHEKYYLSGENIHEMTLLAIARYENKYKVSLNKLREHIVNINDYADLILNNKFIYSWGEDENELNNQINNINFSSNIKNYICIMRIDHFLINNFNHIIEKKLQDVEQDEEIINIIFKSESNDLLNINNIDNFEGLNIIAIVKKTLNLDTIFNIFSKENEDLEEIFVVGKNLLSRKNYAENDEIDYWDTIIYSKLDGDIIDTVAEENGNIWLAKSNGLSLVKSNNNGYYIEDIELDQLNYRINGIKISLNKKFYISENKIYISENGINWNISNEFGTECCQIFIDEQNIVFVTTKNLQIYKSDNEGITWDYVTTKPNKDCSDIFVFNGKILLGSTDGLYAYDLEWNKILNKKSYSFSLSYMKDYIFIGCENEILKTYDLIAFESIITLSKESCPLIEINNEIYYYGYFYNSLSNSFYFKDKKSINDYIRAITSYNILESDNYLPENDINHILKINEINQLKNSYKFIPSTNSIDLSVKSKIIQTVYPTSKIIVIENELNNSNKFNKNDLIEIYVENINDILMSFLKSLKTMRLNGESVIKINAEINKLNLNKLILNKKIYAEIQSISNNTLTLKFPINDFIPLSNSYNIYVRKINSINSSDKIIFSFNKETLINAGKNSHQKIEDTLFTYSDFRKEKINNVFLDNLMQLTNAIRHVYPEIGNNHLNSLFYDFNYDNETINNYIDVANSYSRSLAWYYSDYILNNGGRINDILIGHDKFIDFIFIATSNGLFYSKFKNGIEYNWEHVGFNNNSVNSLYIAKDQLYVGTNSGIYLSSNLNEWEKEQLPFDILINKIAPRWKNENSLILSNHTARFSNNNYSNPSVGHINSEYIDYSNVKIGRIIQVNNAGELNGDYIVLSSSTDEIIVNKGFPLIDEVELENIEIKQIAFQELLTEDFKDIIIGFGKDKIFYKYKNLWKESLYPKLLKNIMANDIITLSNQNIIACFNGRSDNGDINGIIESNNMGDSFYSKVFFNELSFNITNYLKNTNNNIEIFINPLDELSRIFKDGEFKNHEVQIIFANNIYIEKIIWNEYENNLLKIIVRGNNDLNNLLKENYSKLILKIKPIFLNCISCNNNSEEIILGTNYGLYIDKNTYTNDKLEIYINSIWGEGFVDNIGYDFVINEIRMDVSSNNLMILCETEIDISVNQFLNNRLYFIDFYNSGFNLILQNSNVKFGKFSIIVNAKYQQSMESLINKKIKIIGMNSEITANISFVAINNDFNNGNIYIDGSKINKPIQQYKLLNNIDNKFIINAHIVGTEIKNINQDNVVFKGNRFFVTRQDNALKILVSFNKNITRNELSGSKLICLTEDNDVLNFKIHSNDIESIDIKEDVDVFLEIFLNNNIKDLYVENINFYKVNSFDYYKTSIDSDHYHYTNMIKSNISGIIEDIILLNNNYKIIISDIQNWNSIINDCPELPYKAVIKFYNNISKIYYYSRIINLNINELSSEIIEMNWWDMNGYNPIKISKEWKFEVLLENYGITSFPIYNDFAVITRKIIDNINVGDQFIMLISSNGINVGDKIEIFDSFGKKELNYVKNIISEQIIELDNPTSQSFLMINRCFIKVLVDNYENNHTHIIRNNQVELINIQDFFLKGYQLGHAHLILPYIEGINDLEYNGKIFVVGNNSTIISSEDMNNWIIEGDLNMYKENKEDISQINKIIQNNEDLIVGANDGNIFSTLVNEDILKMIEIKVQ
jgi:hypothetical protein